MRQEIVGFGDSLALAGPYANNLHLAADRSTHHHAIFTGRMLFLADAQPTVSKH